MKISCDEGWVVVIGAVTHKQRDDPDACSNGGSLPPEEAPIADKSIAQRGADGNQILGRRISEPSSEKLCCELKVSHIVSAAIVFGQMR